MRRLLRSRWGSLAPVGVAAGPSVLYLLIRDLRDFSLLLAIAGMFLVPGALLAWIVVIDV